MLLQGEEKECNKNKREKMIAIPWVSMKRASLISIKGLNPGVSYN